MDSFRTTHFPFSFSLRRSLVCEIHEAFEALEAQVSIDKARQARLDPPEAQGYEPMRSKLGGLRCSKIQLTAHE